LRILFFARQSRAGAECRALGLALAVAFLLTFDGSRPAGAQADQVIRVGAGAFEANAGAYYAQDNGFFKQVGLNVQIEAYNGGGAIAAAVIGGSLQIGVANPLPVAAAHEKGLDFVIIAPGSLYDVASTPPNLMVAPNSRVRTGKDLEGTTVAVTSLQGLDPLGAMEWIDKNGGDSRRVKLVELPQTLMGDAVASGRVAAAMMADPAVTAALNAGKVRGLSKSYAYIGNHFFVSCWFSSREWADKNPDVVRRFRIAIDRAGDWATRNPEAAAAILHKYMNITVARAREVHAKTTEPYMVQQVIDAAVKYKYLEHPMDARDIIWTTPANR
jgi:NitT/TauT family transport system substrate-binding protein